MRYRRRKTEHAGYLSADPSVCSATACSVCQNTERSCGLGIAQASHPTVQAVRSSGATDDSPIAHTDVSGEISRGATAAQVPSPLASNWLVPIQSGPMSH